MNLETEVKGSCLIVRLAGELDMNSTVLFKKNIIPLLSENDIEVLIFNLSRVKFIDSTGLGAILGRYRELEKKGGKVIIVGLKSQVERIFSLAGMLKIMPVFNTEKEALQNIRDKGVYYLA